MGLTKIVFPDQVNTFLEFQICVNKLGEVTYAEILDNSWAKMPQGKERKVLEVVNGYRYNSDWNAKQEECGKFEIILDNIESTSR